MRVTAHSIAKLKILRGVSGKILTNVNHVRSIIRKPGLFQTLEHTSREKGGDGFYTVELYEIKEWNDAIMIRLKNKDELIKDLRYAKLQ